MTATWRDLMTGDASDPDLHRSLTVAQYEQAHRMGARRAGRSTLLHQLMEDALSSGSAGDQGPRGVDGPTLHRQVAHELEHSVPDQHHDGWRDHDDGADPLAGTLRDIEALLPEGDPYAHGNAPTFAWLGPNRCGLCEQRSGARLRPDRDGRLLCVACRPEETAAPATMLWPLWHNGDTRLFDPDALRGLEVSVVVDTSRIEHGLSGLAAAFADIGRQASTVVIDNLSGLTAQLGAWQEAERMAPARSRVAARRRRSLKRKRMARRRR